jgi:hypothetical protein
MSLLHAGEGFAECKLCVRIYKGSYRNLTRILRFLPRNNTQQQQQHKPTIDRLAARKSPRVDAARSCPTTTDRHMQRCVSMLSDAVDVLDRCVDSVIM